MAASSLSEGCWCADAVVHFRERNEREGEGGAEQEAAQMKLLYTVLYFIVLIRAGNFRF